jgi:hypothetical protein
MKPPEIGRFHVSRSVMCDIVHQAQQAGAHTSYFYKMLYTLVAFLAKPCRKNLPPDGV